MPDGQHADTLQCARHQLKLMTFFDEKSLNNASAPIPTFRDHITADRILKSLRREQPTDYVQRGRPCCPLDLGSDPQGRRADFM